MELIMKITFRLTLKEPQKHSTVWFIRAAPTSSRCAISCRGGVCRESRLSCSVRRRWAVTSPTHNATAIETLCKLAFPSRSRVRAIGSETYKKISNINVLSRLAANLRAFVCVCTHRRLSNLIFTFSRWSSSDMEINIAWEIKPLSGTSRWELLLFLFSGSIFHFGGIHMLRHHPSVSGDVDDQLLHYRRKRLFSTTTAR